LFVCLFVDFIASVGRCKTPTGEGGQIV